MSDHSSVSALPEQPDFTERASFLESAKRSAQAGHSTTSDQNKTTYSPTQLWSERRYVRIHPKKVHMFRFLLEAHDNLGLMSVVDRWGAVLKISCSPHQVSDLEAALQSMRQSLPFEILPF